MKKKKLIRIISIFVLVVATAICTLAIGNILSTKLGGPSIGKRTPEVSNTLTNIAGINKCQQSQTIPLNNVVPELISLQYGTINISSTVSTNKQAIYAFTSEAGNRLNYLTDENVCVDVYDSNGNLLTNPNLNSTGKYYVQVSVAKGSRTFNLKLSLIEPEASQPTKDSVSAEKMHSHPSQTSSPQIEAEISAREPYLGHLPYEVIPKDRVIEIASYGLGGYQRYESLELEAGKALMRLISAARQDGIWIIPTSAFRDIARQQRLFDRQIAKTGSIEAAARISAPPGYSEHHTGYAVDLADGKYPDTDFQESFADTEAYRWLIQHAGEYGFELSFPLNNSQSVMYEPWHWRFVGSRQAATVFTVARESYPTFRR